MDRQDLVTAVEGNAEVKTAEELGLPQETTQVVENTTTEQVETQAQGDAPKGDTTDAPGEILKGDEAKTFFDKPAVEQAKTEENQAKKELTYSQKQLDEYKSQWESEMAAKLEAEQGKEAKVKSLVEKLLGGDIDLRNVSLTELMKKGAGVDYSHLDTKSLVEQSVKADPVFSTLSAEEQASVLEEELGKLDAMNPLEAGRLRNKLLGEMNKSGEDSDVFKALKEIQDEQNKTADAITDPDKYYTERREKERAEIIENIGGQLLETMKGFVGQKYNGFEVTEQHANDMVNWQSAEMKEYNQENRAYGVFKIATYDAYGDYMYQKGKKEAAITQANPSANFTAPVIADKTTDAGFKGASKDDFRKAN